MRVIVVGGGYAGVTTALRLSQRAKKAGASIEITLVNESDEFIERIRLHQTISGEDLRRRQLEPLLARAGINFALGRVNRIDRAARTVTIGSRVLLWDRLVLAVGSRSGRLEVPGAARYAYGVNPGTAPHLRRVLAAARAGTNIVVVGGGLTAIETATEIRERYPELGISLVTRGRIAQDWSPAARSHIVDFFDRNGIALLEQTSVEAVGEGEARISGGVLPSDLCISASGFEIPALGRDAGLATNDAGQVLLDPQLRSISDPEVYVAGDAGAPLLDPGERVPLGCKSAIPLGAHVADNLLHEFEGHPLEAFDYSLLFYCVSLGRRDGLIQFPVAGGRPTGKVMTGRSAALVKEVICRSTMWAIALEARGIEAAVGRKTGHAPQALTAGQMEIAAHDWAA